MAIVCLFVFSFPCILCEWCFWHLLQAKELAVQASSCPAVVFQSPSGTKTLHVQTQTQTCMAHIHSCWTSVKVLYYCIPFFKGSNSESFVHLLFVVAHQSSWKVILVIFCFLLAPKHETKRNDTLTIVLHSCELWGGILAPIHFQKASLPHTVTQTELTGPWTD